METNEKRATPPLTNEGIERLRYAIVKRACKDFNFAYFERKRLERKSKLSRLTKAERKTLISAQSMEADCLKFFRSSWYSMLCDIDPEKLIYALKARRMRDDDED